METWKRKASREKYLEYLEEFIDYEVDYKGRTNLYTIKAIYAEYVKPNFRKKSTVLNDVKEHFNQIWKVGEPETSNRVAAKMINQNLVDSESMSTVVKKVYEVRTEKYGKPGGARGPEGKCYYIRAKLFRNQIQPLYYDKNRKPVWDASKFTYELLTSEEKKKLCEIHTKWYPDDIEKLDILREGLTNNKIKTVEEVANCILEQSLTKDERSQKFLDYTAELATEFGCDWIVRATMVEESIIPCLDNINSFNF